MLKNILLFHSMHEILAASCECCQVSSTSYLPPKQECHAGGCNSSLLRVRRNVAQEIQRHFFAIKKSQRYFIQTKNLYARFWDSNLQNMHPRISRRTETLYFVREKTFSPVYLHFPISTTQAKHWTSSPLPLLVFFKCMLLVQFTSTAEGRARAAGSHPF